MAHISAVQHCRGLRQEYHKFKPVLGNLVKPHLKIKDKKGWECRSEGHGFNPQYFQNKEKEGSKRGLKMTLHSQSSHGQNEQSEGITVPDLKHTTKL